MLSLVFQKKIEEGGVLKVAWALVAWSTPWLFLRLSVPLTSTASLRWTSQHNLHQDELNHQHLPFRQTSQWRKSWKTLRLPAPAQLMHLIRLCWYYDQDTGDVGKKPSPLNFHFESKLLQIIFKCICIFRTLHLLSRVWWWCPLEHLGSSPTSLPSFSSSDKAHSELFTGVSLKIEDSKQEFQNTKKLKLNLWCGFEWKEKMH